ncbi:MAG: formamidopyrimidine-DNA glycosylase [Candidatus Berkelbacteria bacterium Licking1014_96]|uniref:Formamidopyrimidine-DNA glycosylase n=1 Tax=Candidatus Berkelbacteria bacterium Licking1014_96 TaxID=2017149 RepID=A0A554LF43_9BACT|nr:MAG: formamidopyrimidine-DNA glycosylase [Candidatus Berkelbacteria bacterium Licking1014_96]
MPELPEIETIVNGAKKRLIGKKIKSVEIRVPKIISPEIREFKKGSIGVEIKDVRRFAKIIVIDLSNKNSILIHLKLTGQLIFQVNSEQGTVSSKQSLPHNYTHVIFTFSDNSHLYFNDIRKFGYLKLVKTAEVGERPEIKNLGPEPLGDFSYEDFRLKLERRKRSKIKQILMDQKFVSGIGNIYANEILFHASVRPSDLVGNLTENQRKQIFKSIKFILKKAITMGGSSENTYVNLEGKKGDFMKYAKVYRQKTCKVCASPIERIAIGGRGTFYCQSCQK